jgi:hypothetical protein
MNDLVATENRPLTKADVVAQKRLIREVMESVMKEGTHYGIIPGCKQPSLFKAGSEAILSTFRIAVDPSIEDLSTYDCYRYRVTLRGVLPSGEIVGAGIGECSTDEEKYRWRSAVCPAEYDNTPDDRRRIKYSKPSNYNQTGETRQVRTNPSDLANTALKMAKKRAQIDLTLTATGASDVFVQDLEDLPEEIRDELVTENIQKQGKPTVQQPQSKQQSSDNGDKATEGQVKILHVKMKQAGVSESSFIAHYKIASVSDLPKSMVNAAIKAIGDGEITIKPEAKEKVAEMCSNCGEVLDDNGKGHLEGCPNGN